MGKIKIISTSDIHGQIYPYSYADGSSKNYGLARISKMIKRLRDDHTIVIDNGDTIEGSPLTFYHNLNNSNKLSPVTKVMKEIGYDYVNVGNHDFNFGIKKLEEHLNNINSKCITSNVIYDDGSLLGSLYEIREIDNKRIGIFGVTTHFVPYWEKAENIEGLKFIDAFSRAQEVVDILKNKEKVDYIIGVYHGGFEKDPVTSEKTEELTGENQGYRMLNEIKGIDVLIAGHQHRIYEGVVNNQAYTEPHFQGDYLSLIEIDTDTNVVTAKLLEVNDEPDQKIMDLVMDEEKMCQLWLDNELGKTMVDLEVKDEFDARLHKSQVVTFLNNVQFEVSNADLSSVALFLRATGFKKSITMRDLVSTYLYPNTLVVKEINGKILKAYIEKCLEFWALDDKGNIIINPLYDFPNPQHHNYDMVDGVEYVGNISKPIGSRLVSLKRNGVDVKDDDVFSLVINNYRASGGGNFDMIKNAKTISEIQMTMVDIIANYIMKYKVIDFEPINNIVIQK